MKWFALFIITYVKTNQTAVQRTKSYS